jgi:transposase, IS30 family
MKAKYTLTNIAQLLGSRRSTISRELKRRRDRRGQSPCRPCIVERPAHIERRSQVGHQVGDADIGAGHQKAIVTVVERKSGYGKPSTVTNKIVELVSRAIEDKPEPLAVRGKALSVDNGKGLEYHQKADLALDIKTYFADSYAVGNAQATKTTTA